LGLLNLRRLLRLLRRLLGHLLDILPGLLLCGLLPSLLPGGFLRLNGLDRLNLRLVQSRSARRLVLVRPQLGRSVHPERNHAYNEEQEPFRKHSDHWPQHSFLLPPERFPHHLVPVFTVFLFTRFFRKQFQYFPSRFRVQVA
jgi:hypothetical protein